MISRLRIIVLVTRPAVAGLLALFTATGLAQSGHGEDWAPLARALLPVLGFLLFSVACNDLADEAIDRVNLPGQRPLETGAISRRGFAVIGGTAAAVALAASATLRWPALAVTAAGLLVSAGYSLRPVRLADRGAVAALVLPACYVAVPFLAGFFAASPSVRPGTFLLLAGLYTGFIGRILLKDFRDVRGDALFGKRTFLVRHGRRWTCAFSACCWAAGTAILLGAVTRPTAALVLACGGCLAGVLWLLRILAGAPGGRRDECVIGAIAILGRGMLLLLLAHLSMVQAGWAAWRYDATIGALALLVAGQAVSMARHGPLTRMTVPAGWDTAAARRGPQAPVLSNAPAPGGVVLSWPSPAPQSAEPPAGVPARGDAQSSSPPGLAGTSTACSSSAASGTTSRARSWVDASTTGAATPS
jgi:4-hydroxybenzoate polyprenyltransferase